MFKRNPPKNEEGNIQETMKKMLQKKSSFAMREIDLQGIEIT